MKRARVLLSALPLLGLACANEDVTAVENKPPEASILGGGSHAAGVVVAFDGSASLDKDGSIVSFAWDFGDGGSAEGASVEHIYNAGGAFDVVLTVTDDDGATDTATVAVTVTDNAAPVAVITAPAEGALGESLRFDGAGSSDADGSVVAYTWDFGDGTTGTGPLFDKAYEESGVFVARLTVTDDQGASGEAEHTVTIAEGPTGFSGDWSWFLTDEALRDLGLLCGTFQDSQLTILEDGSNITITEHAGGTEVPYSGTLTGSDFNVANNGFGVTQRIVGTFTSDTTFTGTYSIETGVTECADRPVEGTKLPD